MEFNEKLQELRKGRGMTQEELAAELYVSRTAISKWESGRGVPNIESLKAISKFFSVSIDELLSSGELLIIAEDDRKRREARMRDIVFGLIDLGMLVMLFLPLFGQTEDGFIKAVSIIGLSEPSLFLRLAYYDIISSTVICGILMLALQNSNWYVWRRTRGCISIALSVIGVFLFVLSRQPYAAVLVFVFFFIKAFLLLKRP